MKWRTTLLVDPVKLLFQLFPDLHLFRPMILTLSPSTFTTTANHLAGLGPCPFQLIGISSFITHSYECQGASVLLRCCSFVWKSWLFKLTHTWIQAMAPFITSNMSLRKLFSPLGSQFIYPSNEINSNDFTFVLGIMWYSRIKSSRRVYGT